MWTKYALALVSSLFILSAHAEGERQKSEIIIPDYWQEIYENWGFAPAVKTTDGTIYVSGVIAVLEGEGTYAERYERGVRTALGQIKDIMDHAGGSMDDVVEMTSFHIELAHQVEVLAKVRKDVFTKPHSAWTAVGTTALAIPGGVTEIKVTGKIAKD